MKSHILLIAASLMLVACSPGTRTKATTESRRNKPSHVETNSVYCWKTVFAPDSSDFNFLRKHDIGRIYLRMFDVSLDDQIAGDKTVPNASVVVPYETASSLQSQLPSTEFVPVVYVTLDALKNAKGREGRLAGNIVTRVKNMCSYNSLPNVSGLQLDCDWTESTEQSFFSLCDSVKYEIGKQKLNWALSSTIRLHQLARETPPVDYGVLMVYNTGSYKDPDAANSIIDVNDVEPYLKNLSGYRLHLDIAYPTYSWQLLYHKRKFAGLLNGLPLSDTAKFQHIEGINNYRCLEDLPHNKTVIRKGDIVRSESSEYESVMAVKTLIEQKLGSRSHGNVLYHLDLNNLSKYSDNEIENIFSVASSK